MKSADDSPIDGRPAAESLTANVKTATGGSADGKKGGWIRQSFNPFRIATLRGVAVVLPPLLTIIFFVWAWNAIDRAVLRPVESLSRHAVVWTIDKTLTDSEKQEIAAKTADPTSRNKIVDGQQVFVDPDGATYVRIQSNWIPEEVAKTVRANTGDAKLTTSKDYYLRYVEIRYLKRHLVIPAFLALFLVVMYLVGKLLAAGIGRIFYQIAEAMIDRLPIIRNVYSSVKQVTDFVFNDNEIQYTRVVAVEYPRRGVWSMGFVTGDSMLDIRNATGEPMLSVLMPTSPMPATGFTISVPKSETIDLNITIDQAIQFCVSCGVVVPPQQLVKPALEGEVVGTQSDAATAELNFPSTPGQASPEDPATIRDDTSTED
jgi:uncharacterized membrane protein